MKNKLDTILIYAALGNVSRDSRMLSAFHNCMVDFIEIKDEHS